MAETIESIVSPAFPESVWERIRSRSRRLLLLDFDGTLAPFEVDRMAVRVPEESREALARIARSGKDRVAIVSGRPIAELERLIGTFEGSLAGEHGWEEKNARGTVRRHTPGLRARILLQLAEWVVVFMRCGERLEKKRASIVLHTRGVTSERTKQRVHRCARVLHALFVHDCMRLDAFNGGYELRDCTRSKGTVALGLLENGPEGALPVYLGDDVSDEDAFEVVRPLGVTVRVGRAPRESAAEWTLDSPHAVADFLACWAEMTEAS